MSYGSAAWPSSSEPWIQRLRSASIGTPELYFKGQHVFKALSSGSSLRELVAWKGYPAPPHHEYSQPTGVRDIGFPSLKRVYWSSSHDFTIDTAHLIHGLSAHTPHLDDLTICCARFESSTPPLVSPIASIKRYAFTTGIHRAPWPNRRAQDGHNL